MNSHPDLYSSPIPHGSEPLAQSHTQVLDHGSHAHLSANQSYPHLTDSQIDDQLIGDLAAEPAAHLAACPICIGRVASTASPITSFQSVTMAWSERRAATLPIPDFDRQQPSWQHHMTWAMACFVFAVGIALTTTSHQAIIATAEFQPMQQDSPQQNPTRRTVPPSAVPTETARDAAGPREAQIFADNQLLKAIDEELDTSVDSPATLGIQPVSAHPSRSSTTSSVQD